MHQSRDTMHSVSEDQLPQRRSFYRDLPGVDSNYSADGDDNFTRGVMVDEKSLPNGQLDPSGTEASKFKIRPDSILAKLALPCQADDYDYGQCYSYYANGCYNVCQFVDCGDIEDFMNNEKRKEKSRDAARSRRSRETEIFTDLANALPLTSEQISQLDKASVMRLAISYLRVRDMASLVPELDAADESNEDTDGSVFLKSLEGFLIVLSPEGDFVYLSDNVSDYLGISQIDLMGQNVFEYSHPCDHDEIREVLSGKAQDDTDTPKSMFIRLKCTLTSKGRSVNLKSATYKVIHCTGHIVKSTSDKKENIEKGNMQSCFVAVGQPIPHPSNIEAPLPRQTFLTKHSLNMKFTHADDEFMKNILGYEPDDLLGKSVYEYHHAMDSDSICSAYKCLFAKGQCETNRYRFLAKTGGYVWVVTQATLIYDKMQKPQSVVCVNYVISGVECKDEIYSASQFSSVKSETPIKSCKPVPEIVLSVVDDNNTVLETTGRKPVSTTAKLFVNIEPEKEPDNTPRPHTATTKIFGPRTKDMNKGFLTFSEEEPGLTMLKDEPDDLTHLAPVAGDVCVPLDEHPFLPDNMLEDFLLKDNFGPLLSEEPSDPFISYRDFHDPSPQLLSPNLSKNSDCSLPSLNSPSDSLIDEDQMSTFMNLHMDDESELAVKAPFISMNDDLPLLMSNDLMWSNNEKNKNQLPDSNSSLAQLLSTSLHKHNLKANDHGGGVIRDQNMEEIYNEKNTFKTWGTHYNNNNNRNDSHLNKMERSPTAKRPSTTSYDQLSKKPKSEPQEKMSSELLHQLISNNHNRGRMKGKSNWLLDSGRQKAACISQPSDSVLMNLLGTPMEEDPAPNLKLDLDMAQRKLKLVFEKDKIARRNLIRKNSISLLDPEATAIPSLLDLTQQDFEVNAPVGNFLLQGEELLTALEVNSPI